jgi:hypothetical protein
MVIPGLRKAIRSGTGKSLPSAAWPLALKNA